MTPYTSDVAIFAYFTILAVMDLFLFLIQGEVMVNNHVHVKTYTTIHALVDGMFPPVCSSEQVTMEFPYKLWFWKYDVC